MLWKKRDLGSDYSNPIFVTTDIPTVEIEHEHYVSVLIPIAAYKRLADWASMGRTMDSVEHVLHTVTPDENRRSIASDVIEALRKSLQDIHGAIHDHYIRLPNKLVEKTKRD